MMQHQDGLLFAHTFGGGGQSLSWDDIHAWSADDTPFWLHVDYSSPRVEEWLLEHSGLSELSAQALLAEDTRPRCSMLGEGLLLCLRGVNLNPEAEPQDMVAIRLWSDGRRVITSSRRQLLAIRDIRDMLESSGGPANAAEFIVTLCENMNERIANVAENLDESIDRLELEVLTSEKRELRTRIAALRGDIISLRRYLAPQREALTRLAGERLDWMGETQKLYLREIVDRALRIVEDLDSAQARAGLLYEQLMSNLTEKLNSRMYLLAMVTAFFLPLGFVTGLLGMNVGGIPGANTGFGFIGVILLIVLVVGFQYALFRFKRWL